jgi:hypothetical protein
MGQNQYGAAGQPGNNRGSSDRPVRGEYGKVPLLITCCGTLVNNGMGHGMDISVGTLPAKRDIRRAAIFQKTGNSLFCQILHYSLFHDSLTRTKTFRCRQGLFQIIYTCKLTFFHARPQWQVMVDKRL